MTTMQNRELLLAVLSVMSLVRYYNCCSAATSSPPNIVLILSDDQGFHDVGYHGSELPTPHLDELAAGGVKLENYYVQPVCSPSRSQLMTGRYQIHTGLQHRIIRPSQPFGLPLNYPTLADYLREQGYTTHVVGKWHLGFYREDYTPLQRGFDTFFGILPGAADHYSYIQCDTFRGSGHLEANITDAKWCGYSLMDMAQPAREDNGTYSTHLYTGKAIEVVKKAAQSQKPLFLYLSYQAPHSPLQVPNEYYSHLSNIVNRDRMIYGGMLSAMDEGIRNLTEVLKDTGMWNNTVLIFSSDNGAQIAKGGSNWPLRGTKASLWEGGIRTVGFVASPLLSPGQRGKVSSEMMHVSDWFPTIAAMAGAALNKSLADELDGVNQWPMIKDGAASLRTEILHNIDVLSPRQGTRLYNDTFDTRVRAAIRLGDFKLITGDPGDGRSYSIPDIRGFEKQPFYGTFNETTKNVWLFNIKKDPVESDDLSAAMPGKVRELLEQLKRYNAKALPPWYPDSDPECDPALHGDVWIPWK